MDLTEELINQISDQLFIDTATWFVSNYEKECGLTPKSNQTLEDRRNAIEAKWKADGTATLDLLQSIADSWENGDISVTFDGQTITFEFVSNFGIPSDLDGFKNAVDDVKPAHLPINFIFKYVLWKDITGKHTWSSLSTKTWNGIRDGDLH